MTEEAPVAPPVPDLYVDGDPALFEALCRADEILGRDDNPPGEIAASRKGEICDESIYGEAVFSGEVYEVPEMELSEAEKAERLAQIEESEATERNRGEGEILRSIEVAKAELLHPFLFRTEESSVVTGIMSVRAAVSRQETAAR